MSRLAIHARADRLDRAENLLDAIGQVFGERFGAHCACNVDDRIEVNVAAMLDVLLLLPVARRLFQCLDDEGRS